MAQPFHFKITLQGSTPPIWRKFTVTDDYRLDRFHQVIQIVMGWRNAHLHDFAINGRRIGMLLDDDLDLPDLEDETNIYLRDLNLKTGSTFSYLYDFGDGWEHQLELENSTAEPLPYPHCTKGKGACPPEDCGGVWGYMDILAALKNPDNPEHEDWLEWISEDFDPAYFPIDAINAELKRFGAWHQNNPNAKSTPWHQLE